MCFEQAQIMSSSFSTLGLKLTSFLKNDSDLLNVYNLKLQCVYCSQLASYVEDVNTKEKPMIFCSVSCQLAMHIKLTPKFESPLVIMRRSPLITFEQAVAKENRQQLQGLDKSVECVISVHTINKS